MQLLFISSNQRDKASLALEREITELQIRALSASGDPVSITFLPDICFEDIPSAISKHKPDILHISCHGSRKALSFRNSLQESVDVSGVQLAQLLKRQPPTLVYLSACDSHKHVQALTQVVRYAIGTETPITNYAARQSASYFYEMILAGHSVQEAFNASSVITSCMDGEKARNVLAKGRGADTTEVLYVPTYIVASLADKAADNEGRYCFDLGVIGCPTNTCQVVFFTDDEDYAWADGELEEHMVSIVRGRPANGELWGYEAWTAFGDTRIYAAVTTMSGQQLLTPATTLSRALESYFHMFSKAKELPKFAARAIKALKENDGTYEKAAVKKSAASPRSGAEKNKPDKSGKTAKSAKSVKAQRNAKR